MKPLRMRHRPIEEELRREPQSFELHQALRILERMRGGTLMPGETTLFDRECVRFSSRVSKGFPPSVIAGLERNASPSEPPTLTVNHLGLAGAHGVLPEFVTDEILRQRKTGESPLQDFLDIFNHRLVALHARVRRTYRPTYINVPPERSPLARIVFSLIGLGLPVGRNAMQIADRELIPFAGLLVGTRRSVSAIEAMLSEYTGCRTKVVPFRPAWLPLDRQTTTRIGHTGRNATLGQNAICGIRAYNPLDGYTVRIGPCSAARFAALKPGGSEHAALRDLIRFLFHDAGTVELQLQLERDAARPARIGRSVELGRTAWLAPHRLDPDSPHRFIATVLVYRWNADRP
jgi:type VI secretion system protein ImpH